MGIPDFANNSSHRINGEVVFKKYFTSGKTYSWKKCAEWYASEYGRKPDGVAFKKQGLMAAAWRWASENPDEAKNLYGEFYKMWMDFQPMPDEFWKPHLIYMTMRYKNHFNSVRKWMKDFPEYRDQDIYNASSLSDAFDVYDKKYKSS